MVSKQRGSLRRKSSPSDGKGPQSRNSRAKKPASKSVYLRGTSTRTRTSLIGTTIYQPDVKPSILGRKLLAALKG